MYPNQTFIKKRGLNEKNCWFVYYHVGLRKTRWTRR